MVSFSSNRLNICMDEQSCARDFVTCFKNFSSVSSSREKKTQFTQDTQLNFFFCFNFVRIFLLSFFFSLDYLYVTYTYTHNRKSSNLREEISFIFQEGKRFKYKFLFLFSFFLQQIFNFLSLSFFNEIKLSCFEIVNKNSCVFYSFCFGFWSPICLFRSATTTISLYNLQTK